jgi:hypothetical protein
MTPMLIQFSVPEAFGPLDGREDRAVVDQAEARASARAVFFRYKQGLCFSGRSPRCSEECVPQPNEPLLTRGLLLDAGFCLIETSTSWRVPGGSLRSEPDQRLAQTLMLLHEFQI